MGNRVRSPPLKNDELRSSTVLPYLDAYHYGTDEMEQDYYTEHDLTGQYEQWVPINDVDINDKHKINVQFSFLQPNERHLHHTLKLMQLNEVLKIGNYRKNCHRVFPLGK